MDGEEGGLVASVATELARFDAAAAEEAAAEERTAARQELRQELGRELRQELKSELRATLAESAVGAGAEAEARWLEMGAAVQATGRRVEALETALGSHAARQVGEAAAAEEAAEAAAEAAEAAAEAAAAQQAQQARGLEALLRHAAETRHAVTRLELRAEEAPSRVRVPPQHAERRPRLTPQASGMLTAAPPAAPPAPPPAPPPAVPPAVITAPAAIALPLASSARVGGSGQRWATEGPAAGAAVEPPTPDWLRSAACALPSTFAAPPVVAEARAAGTEVAAHEMGVALRAELAAAAAAAAAARAQDMRQLGEAQSLALKMLADEMRWLDEEHMRCRAEDQAAHTRAVEELRSEVDGRLGLVQGNVKAQLQSAAAHVEQLDGAMAQLCASMETARLGEVAPLAKERISAREVHLAPTQARHDEALSETQAAAEVEEEEEESPALVEDQLYAYMRPPPHDQAATAASTAAPEELQESGADGGKEGGEAAGREADGEVEAEAEAEAGEARLAKCVWPPSGMNDPEEQAAWWVGAVTGREQPEGSSLQAWLKDGVVLCELINTISPGSAAKPSTSEMPFRQMGNIATYAKAARLYGVPEPDMFVTVDLFEGKNLPAVVQNLHSLGRVAQQRGFAGPACLGVRLASKNVRQFSQAQLDEARAMTALRLRCNLVCGRLQPYAFEAVTPYVLRSTPVCT